jgi:FkbM family methyltransferase
MSTRSSLKVAIANRSEIQLYQQIFVKDIFNLENLPMVLPIKKPMVFDLGANCGFFSLRILDIYPDAKIYAFEPQHSLVKSFNNCINQNQLSDKVEIRQTAVGDTNGKSIFYENRSPISASLVKEKVSRRSIRKKYEIDHITVDQFCSDSNISCIDILKIDVEGSEIDVLKGANDIMNTVKVLFIEVHPPFATANQIENILNQYNLVRDKTLERAQTNDHDLVFTKNNGQD